MKLHILVLVAGLALFWSEKQTMGKSKGVSSDARSAKRRQAYAAKQARKKVTETVKAKMLKMAKNAAYSKKRRELGIKLAAIAT